MTPPDRGVQIWLVAVYASIAVMVVIGGTTRLTASGLSMVEWHPLMGAIPPIGDAAWQEAFARYKEYPQYQQVNSWMELGDFKRIFFWEYVHRLFGRLLGLIFALPWLYFVVRGRLKGAWIGKTAIAFFLGGAQGLLGWYMVKSGLVDVPQVSHLRLAAHLMLALTVGNYTLWLALQWSARERVRWHGASWALVALVAVQILWGAFMAGSRAGYLFATFPTMNGAWIPSGMGAEGGLIESVLHNPIGIHFTHRSLAYVVAIAVGAWAWLHRSCQGRQRLAWRLVVGTLVAQFLLGVATVMTSVHIVLGVAHQAGGMALLSAAVFAAHSFGSPRAAD